MNPWIAEDNWLGEVNADEVSARELLARWVPAPYLVPESPSQLGPFRSPATPPAFGAEEAGGLPWSRVV